ncbi:hypothetical protein JTE90_024804 [Oedothorax gibbosus]|uniref:Uncharacterized protein n=1 Tax=Oedothorax gibbosus TaxID=931172 RepID=A0AAV6UN24_9ARAC|nr:hypothetical protein JTE90_024804 [Oedothorax gibbosus]
MVCTIRSDERLEEIFKYELCAYLPSLFDESGLMRKGSKSSMVTVLFPDSNETSIIPNSEKVSYIIDMFSEAFGDMKDVLVPIYAFTGCDIVSTIYKEGENYAV